MRSQTQAKIFIVIRKSCQQASTTVLLKKWNTKFRLVSVFYNSLSFGLYNSKARDLTNCTFFCLLALFGPERSHATMRSLETQVGEKGGEGMGGRGKMR